MDARVSNSDPNARHRLREGRLTRPALLMTGALCVGVMAVVSLAVGPTGVSLASLPRAISAWLGHTTEPLALREKLVLVDVRLPRTLLAMFVGAALALAGAMMQGLFRNPLADPGLVGVSPGAALAAVTIIVLGNSFAAPFVRVFGAFSLPLAAFCGGLGTTFLLVLVASRRGGLSIGTLLLTGIAIGALAGALTGFMAYASDDRELRDLTLWTLGSLAGSSWQKVGVVLPFAALLVVCVPWVVRGLNGFLLGEAEAYHLGIDVERTKKIVIGATAAAVGAAVAVSGVIGFVGLVVPHLVRLLGGPDHRIVLPGSALFGAALVLCADIIARMTVRPAELPIGIVLAAVGAPIFLHLVLRRGIGGTEAS
jgi:iron complex transport system permease protein